MRAFDVTPREDFNQLLDEAGEHLWPTVTYIDPNHVAAITEGDADFLESAAKEMYQMCLAAVDKVVRENRFAEFGIGPLQAKHITASWNRENAWPDGSTRDPELYGRFDFAWDGKDALKFYEFNADTPTSAYECSVVQWAVVKDLIAREQLPDDVSQFNTLEEKVTERLTHVFNMASGKVAKKLHFTASTDYREDNTTTSYLEALAKKAGWETEFVDIGLIGANENPESPDYGALFDHNDQKIDALYKLMPWEHLYEGDYAKYIARDEVLFIEPPWKALLSNKMLSVVLWEMYPDHKYLLPTYKTPEPFKGTYVEKPIFGRLGNSIKVFKNDRQIAGDVGDPDVPAGDYSSYPKIYQQFHPLSEMPGMPGWRYQTGIWVVGDGEVGGMDIRVDKSLVTGTGQVKFLPHVMVAGS